MHVTTIGAALLFFVLYAIYMVLISCCCSIEIPMSGISHNIKRICALIGAVSNMIITGWVIYYGILLYIYIIYIYVYTLFQLAI